MQNKNKPLLFFLLGIVCGYTTSLRITGIMLFSFLLLFLLIDLLTSYANKGNIKKSISSIILFATGFCVMLYIVWPYLWHDSFTRFMEAFKRMSHFEWNGYVLLNGQYEHSQKLPWDYFPTWFLITNPEMWLLAGIAGIVWISINFFKKPLSFLKNTNDRNFLLYLMCFCAPILAAIVFHSAMYDDWRHLYFIYPSFVLMALYFINKMLQTRYKLIVGGICVLEVVLISFFMIQNHPFSQVYFNNLVSHEKEYLRKHYDMEYWGCSVIQGLNYLLETDKSKIIKVNENLAGIVDKNITLLPNEDRKRIQISENGNVDADYLITTFRLHPYDYPSYKIDYSISVLNSTILQIYKLEKDSVKQQQYNLENISLISKYLANHPKNYNALESLAIAYTEDKKYPEAINLYRKMIEINMAGENATVDKRALSLRNANLKLVYLNLNHCYMQLMQYDSAIINCKHALILDSSFPGVHMLLGTAYYLKSDFDSAAYYYKQAITLNPNDAVAINNLGGVYLRLKNYSESIIYSKRCISLNPNYLNAYSNLSHAYYLSGQYQQAIETIIKELAIDKNPIDIPYIALSYQKLGNINEARKYEAIAKQYYNFKLE